MDRKEREYVVDARDENGQPSIIGLYEVTPPSYLKMKDDKKIGKKRLRERQSFQMRNQQRLHSLYTLPSQLDRAKNELGRREMEAVETTDEKKPKDEISETKTENIETSQPITQGRASNDGTKTHAAKDVSSLADWWILYLVVSIFFLLMAVFPPLRKDVHSGIHIMI